MFLNRVCTEYVKRRKLEQDDKPFPWICYSFREPTRTRVRKMDIWKICKTLLLGDIQILCFFVIAIDADALLLSLFQPLQTFVAHRRLTALSVIGDVVVNFKPFKSDEFLY